MFYNEICSYIKSFSFVSAELLYSQVHDSAEGGGGINSLEKIRLLSVPSLFI